MFWYMIPSLFACSNDECTWKMLGLPPVTEHGALSAANSGSKPDMLEPEPDMSKVR